MFVTDSGSKFSHPGSRVKKISDPLSESASKNFRYFLPKKIVSKLSEVWSGMFIPDLGSRILIFYSSRITDRGVKKAPDIGSGSATLAFRFTFLTALLKGSNLELDPDSSFEYRSGIQILWIWVHKTVCKSVALTVPQWCVTQKLLYFYGHF